MKNFNNWKSLKANRKDTTHLLFFLVLESTYLKTTFYSNKHLYNINWIQGTMGNAKTPGNEGNM